MSLEIQPLKKRESDKKGFSFHSTLAVDVTWVFLVNSCERGKWVGGDCLSHVCRAQRVNVHIPGERCQHVCPGGEAPAGTSLRLPGGWAERLLWGAGTELGGASHGVALGSLSPVVGEKVWWWVRRVGCLHAAPATWAQLRGRVHLPVLERLCYSLAWTKRTSAQEMCPQLPWQFGSPPHCPPPIPPAILCAVHCP